MSGKFLFVVGVGVGYVLGAKAGRQRYEQIASAADKVWNSSVVKQPRQQVTEYIETQAPKVAGKAAEAATKGIRKVTNRNKAV